MNDPIEAIEEQSTSTHDPDVTYRRRVRIMVGLLLLMVLVGANLAISIGKLQFKKVISESMQPTLMVGDVILVDADAMPVRFDVITLVDPEMPDAPLVKRIVGVPGDRIALVDGKLYLNGRLEESDQVSENRIIWNDIDLIVPPDHYFVLGDNRNNSFDSLNFGPVPTGEVLGVAGMIVWPPSPRWGSIAPLHPIAED